MSIGETFESMFRKRFGRAPTQEELTVLVDQSVKSYNQSGGITAHTVNFAPQPRRMDGPLKADILANIPKTTPITVMAVLGDAEAIQFAMEIHAFLKANNFPLSEAGISQGVFRTPMKGLTFQRGDSTLVVGVNPT